MIHGLNVLFCFWVSVAGSQANIVSRMLDQDMVSISVLPFESTGGAEIAEDESWEILRKDFDFSSRFEYHGADEFDSADFADNSIPLFVAGSYSVQGDTVDLTLRLMDAIRQERVLQKRYRYTTGSGRSVMHTFANEVHNRIFAEEGVFTSAIYYTQNDGRGRNVYRMDFDGHNARTITRGDLNIMPAPGKERELYWVSFARGKADLYKGYLDEGVRTPFFASRRVESSPQYSDISGRVVFASSHRGNMDIYTLTAEGEDLQRLTTSNSVDISPAWSPNGYVIAFISDRSGSPQIYRMNREGEDVRRITYGGTYFDSPAWSPTGEKLAYTSRRDGRFDIFTSKIDGSEEKNITAGISGSHQSPSWSPDGEYIAFQSRRNGASDIYIIRLKDSELFQITHSGSAVMPAWARDN
jgi:TolB protein